MDHVRCMQQSCLFQENYCTNLYLELLRPYTVDRRENNIEIQVDKMFLHFCLQLDSKIQSKCIKKSFIIKYNRTE